MYGNAGDLTEQAKAWLSRGYWIDKELEALYTARNAVFEQLTRVSINYTAKVSGSQDIHKFDSIAVLDEQIKRITNDLLAVKSEILRAIESIRDDKQRTILIRRYIKGESFDNIADSLCYEVRHIYRIHGAALNEIVRRNSNLFGGQSMGDITKKKLVAALGMNMPSVHDIVKRENYKTEEEYLSALVETSAKMNNPEVKAALREAKRDNIEEQEETIRAQQRDQYNKILSEVRLSAADISRIDKEAATLARQELAAGKIQYSQLGETIERYANKLTEEHKTAAATNQQFNEFFRESVKTGTIR